MLKNKKIAAGLLLFTIVFLGFLLRSVNIENAPPGVYPDESVNGMDALNAINNGRHDWFYTANQGREGMFMNLVSFCFQLFGPSIFTLRLPAMVFGTLTILGTYLLAKELFNRSLALFSSFLVATSFWAINFSRISFRANMLPPILAFTFFFLFRGLRTHKWWDFAISGFIFGIGMHSYIAWRISPLILVAMLIVFIITRKDFLKNYWKAILVFFLFSLIAAAPMIYTFWIHPEFLESRSASISIFAPDRNNGSVALTFLRTFSLSLIKYVIAGDMNWRHNYPPYPLLDPLTGIAFMFGFVYALRKIYKILKLRFAQKVHDAHVEPYALLIIWLFVMLIPEFMAAEGNPHALRSIGTLPAVFILAAIAFDQAWRIAYRKSPEQRKKIIASFTIMLAAIGLFNTIKYHVFWASKPVVASSFNKNITDISRYINTLPANEEKIVVTSYNTLIKFPIYIFHSTDKSISYYYPNELEKAVPQNPKNVIFIFVEKNDSAISFFQEKYPNLVYEEVDNSLESKFYILRN